MEATGALMLALIWVVIPFRWRMCVASSGKVYVFEPLPTIFNQFKTTIDRCDLSLVISAHQYALSDVPGETDFVLVHEAPEYSGLRPHHYDKQVTTETIRVQMSRLDDLFVAKVQTIRYIKINCAGGELKVLRGASDLLRMDHSRDQLRVWR